MASANYWSTASVEFGLALLPVRWIGLPHGTGEHPFHDLVGQFKNSLKPLLLGHGSSPQHLVAVARALQCFEILPFLCFFHRMSVGRSSSRSVQAEPRPDYPIHASDTG